MKEPEERKDFDIMKVIDASMAEWEKLGVVRSKEGLVLPYTIKVRIESGGFEETKCFLQALDRPHRWEARKRARKWASDLSLDPNRIDGPDKDVVLELETIEELAYAIRETDAPHYTQMFPNGPELIKRFKTIEALKPIYGVADHWTMMQGPMFGELTREQLWKVIKEIERTATLVPLMSIGGLEQARCIQLMARAALSSPMNPFSPQSSSTSKPSADSQEPASASSS